MLAQKLFVSVLFLISGMFLIEAPLHAQISEAEKIYEEGVYQLEAAGNFEEAITLFNRVVNEYPANKPVAAKALLKKGFCYERLGSQKATEAYEQIINQYPDQVSLVTQARDRLAELRKVEPAGLTMTRLLPPDIYLECQTLSPDGTKLAGIGWNQGQNIAVYDLATGELKYITDYNYSRKSCTTYALVWSPDSREIVHWVSCWGDPDEEFLQLRITTLDGESRVLFRNTDGGGITPCDWLPDTSAVLAVMGDKDGLFKLVLISVKDGALRELCPLQRTYHAQDLPMAEASGSADVSPDGKFIAFADGPAEGKQDIFIISLYGGAKIHLTDHPAGEIEPRWSPDGGHIVFRSNRHGSWALWGVAIRDGQAEGAPFMILEGMQDQELASWTEKGLCTRTMACVNDIYTLEMDIQNNMALGKPRILETHAYGNSSFPLWSPDGKYLAYKSYIQSDESQYLVIMTLKGGEIRKYKSIYAVRPEGGTYQWLPDSAGIGLIYWDKEKNLYFSQLNPDTGEWKTRQILTGDFTGGLRQLTWSGDGKTFFYTKMEEDGEGIGIISHDLETGRERYMLHNIEGDSVEWRWWNLRTSRDYKRLAFNWNNKLGLLDISTGNPEWIDCGDEQILLAPSWSPDGRYLLTKGPHEKGDDFNELFVVSLADGTYKSLNISQFLPRGARIMISHDWSPDGKTIVFDTRTWKSEANLIQNVIPEK
jgi:Tol biopolymer transport system component